MRDNGCEISWLECLDERSLVALDDERGAERDEEPGHVPVLFVHIVRCRIVIGIVLVYDIPASVAYLFQTICSILAERSSNIWIEQSMAAVVAAKDKIAGSNVNVPEAVVFRESCVRVDGKILILPDLDTDQGMAIADVIDCSVIVEVFLPVADRCVGHACQFLPRRNPALFGLGHEHMVWHGHEHVLMGANDGRVQCRFGCLGGGMVHHEGECDDHRDDHDDAENDVDTTL